MHFTRILTLMAAGSLISAAPMENNADRQSMVEIGDRVAAQAAENTREVFQKTDSAKAKMPGLVSRAQQSQDAKEFEPAKQVNHRSKENINRVGISHDHMVNKGQEESDKTWASHLLARAIIAAAQAHEVGQAELAHAVNEAKNVDMARVHIERSENAQVAKEAKDAQQAKERVSFAESFEEGIARL